MSLVTISQDFGSEGFSIAKQIADSLGLELYDDERFKNEALKEDISTDNLQGLEEKAPRFFDRLMGHKPDIYLDILQNIVYRISRSGTGVIVGHGSQILLKDFDCALHVRIQASEKKRAESIASKGEIPYDEAIKLIRKKDQEYKGFFKYAFNTDPSDPILYDIVLNTDKISQETAAKYIAEMARSDEIKACSLSALESMDRMSLEKKIHAKLLEQGIAHGFFFNPIIAEVPEPGKVVISGMARGDEEKNKVLEIIGNIKDVSEFEDKLLVVRQDFLGE